MRFCSVRALISDEVVLSLFWRKYFITILRWGKEVQEGILCWNISIFPPGLARAYCCHFRSDILTRRGSKLPVASYQTRRSYELPHHSPFTTPTLPQKHPPPLPSSPRPRPDDRIYAQPVLSQVCSCISLYWQLLPVSQHKDS